RPGARERSLLGPRAGIRHAARRPHRELQRAGPRGRQDESVDGGIHGRRRRVEGRRADDPGRGAARLLRHPAAVPAPAVRPVEANIGWIPTVLEQLDDMFLRYRWFSGAVELMKEMPSRIFHRNFWATFMIDTVGIELRHRLNVDHVMWSTDYPHTGSDWPNHRVTLD